jgi:hypothetical protein
VLALNVGLCERERKKERKKERKERKHKIAIRAASLLTLCI